jgi:hypothetical protein
MNIQQELIEKQTQNASKKANRTKKPRKNNNVMDDDNDLHTGREIIHDEDIMPVEITTNKQRYNKLTRRERSEESSEEHYDIRNKVPSGQPEAGTDPTPAAPAAPPANEQFDDDEL